jgi:hypothetical protein
MGGGLSTWYFMFHEIILVKTEKAERFFIHRLHRMERKEPKTEFVCGFVFENL